MSKLALAGNSIYGDLDFDGERFLGRLNYPVFNNKEYIQKDYKNFYFTKSIRLYDILNNGYGALYSSNTLIIGNFAGSNIPYFGEYHAYKFQDYNADNKEMWRKTSYTVISIKNNKEKYEGEETKQIDSEIYNDSGTLIYSGTVGFSDENNRNGIGTSFLETYKYDIHDEAFPSQYHYIYEGEWLDGKRHGIGILWDSKKNNIILEGNWKNGVFVDNKRRSKRKRNFIKYTNL